MPTCLICFDRPFPTAKALKQHLRTSTDYHPYCDVCNKYFSGLPGYDMHMASVHPHVRGCGICNVRYRTHRDLSKHFYESAAHPTCYKCHIGLKTRHDLLVHNNTLHIQFRCDLCKINFEGNMADIQSHYLISPSHPKCFVHNIGFKNDLEYNLHCTTAHPPPGITTCPLEVDVTDSHISDSAFEEPSAVSPKSSPQPNVCTETVDNATAPRMASPHAKPDVIEAAAANSSGTGDHPASPISAHQTVDYSTTIVDASVPSLQPLVPPPPCANLFSETVDTPQMASPQGMPNAVETAAADRLDTGGHLTSDVFTYRTVDGVTTIAHASTPPSPHASLPYITVVNLGHTDADSPVSDPSSYTEVSPTDSLQLVVASAGGHLAVNEEYTFCTAPATPDTTTPDPSTPADDTDTTITVVASPLDNPHPAMTGSASLTMAALLNVVEAIASPMRPDSPLETQCVDVPVPVSPVLTCSGESHDITLQADLEALDAPMYSPVERRSRRVEIMEHITFDLPPSEVATSTNRTEDPMDLEDNPYPQSPTNDEEDISSNVLYTPHEGRFFDYPPSTTPPKPRIRISTASTTPRSSTLTSPSSMSESSEPFCRSPSVSPPAGLARLPSISPFELTPIDPPIYELRSRTQTLQITIPEHLNTLLHLASSLSPSMPMADDLHTPSSLSLFSETLSESPQDPETVWGKVNEEAYGESIMAEQFPLPDSVSSTPIDDANSPTGLPGLPLWEQQNDGNARSLLDYTLPSAALRKESMIPRPSSNVEQETASQSTEPLTPQPRLHCRVCQRSPCVDITATMCGHIFCYGCITDAVIKTSKCPLCATPTLLYCLFRLDLSS